MARTVWRWLERDVFGMVTPYGSPSYAYGKVTGLYPDVLVMTETTESPWVCCGYCSVGMVCRTTKAGLGSGMNSTAHPIRSKGGRPHNYGSNATELRNGSRLAHNVTLDAVAISEITGRLRKGHAVEVALQYARLPAYLRVQSNDFGHSVMLFGWKESGDYVGFFDPLWPQGARGAWARWADVKPALWGDGQHNAARSHLTQPIPPVGPPVPPVGPPVPPVPPVQPPTPQLPSAGLWVAPSPSWGIVAWNRPPIEPPAPPPPPVGISWWGESPWHPAGHVPVFGIDSWGGSPWTSGRW
jgi:hypothetical protein